ncbi:MAG: NADH-quinone oxidoreductase subunit C [Bacteroidales bacterium]
MTDSLTILESARKKYSADILETETKSGKRATVTIKPSSLVNMAGYLFRDLNLRFIIATALHTKQGMEIYYHFSHDPSGLILNLHVILPEEKPEIESLTCMFEAANWIEREMHEILGINFLNHPNLEKLISEGNWAEGVYPYRKEFNH